MTKEKRYKRKMTFKDFIKIILSLVLPVLIIVITQAIASLFTTENYIMKFILAVLCSVIDAFLITKWMLFVSDHNWM
jgi:hypothetical protein